MPRSLKSAFSSRAESDALLERLRTFGPSDLKDDELLAVALAPDAPWRVLSSASALLDQTGGLGTLLSLSRHSLETELDLGPQHSVSFEVHRELAERVRVRAARRHLGQKLTPDAVFSWAREILAPLEHEEVWILLVSAASRMDGAAQIARGGSHGCALLPKDLLRAAIRGAAAAFVLVHNHPSGDPRPSEEDIDLTTRLIPLANAVGCPLLDHVIIGGGTYRSLRAEGLCFHG